MEYLEALSMIIPLAESKSEKRQGLQPVLRKDKELYLVNWAVEMNKIGYGQTRRQICEMVKKNLRYARMADQTLLKITALERTGGSYAFLARNNLTI